MASFFQEDLHSSDSDDDDYVPDAEEATSDYDDEEPIPLEDDEIQTKSKKSRKGRDFKVEKNKIVEESLSAKTKVDEKQRANDLFKSFLEEVEAEMKVKEHGILSTPENESPSTSENKTPVTSPIADSAIGSGKNSLENTPETKSLSQVLEFAGETVSASPNTTTQDQVAATGMLLQPKPVISQPLKRKGLQSVLGTLMNKNKKLTTLQKTSLDWNKFKQEHGIAEELQTFNRGRGGYIERKRFLERSDVKTYEVERDLKMSKRKKN